MEISAYEVGYIGGAIIAGLISGILAVVIALKNRQPGLAIIGFMGCIWTGYMWGLPGGLVALAFFGMFSWLMKTFDEPDKPSTEPLKSSKPPGKISGVWIAIASVFGFVIIVVFSVIGVITYEKRESGEPFLAASVRLVREFKNGERNESSAPVKRVLSEARMREFQSSDGRLIKARLISFDGETVEIVREDGKPFRSSISRYSSDDQSYIRSFL